MLNRAWQIFIKEMIQIYRDRRMRFIILGAPIFQLLLMGYAAVIDVSRIPTAVLDRDRTPESRDLISRFGSSGYFVLTHHLQREKEVSDLLDRETVNAALVIPAGFSRHLKKGWSAPLQVIVDGSNSSLASVVMSYSSVILQAFSFGFIRERLGAASMPPGTIRVEPRIFYNPGLENRFFYIPAIIGLIAMVIGMAFMSMSIVREKEQGTLEQIIVTPIRPIELIMGKILPFTLMVLIAVSLQILLALFWFHIPLRGSIVLLFLFILLFLLASLGGGLFISTISQTQQQALLTTFFFLMPAMLLSGFLFPIQNMPVSIQYLTYLNPLRYFMIAARGIFLKGVGFGVLWPEFLALAVMGAAIFALSALRFRKRMG